MSVKSIILTVLALAIALGAQESYIEERILAVVDDRIVTSSQAEVALLMDLGGKLPEDTTFVKELLRAKVEELVNEELILLAAEAESIEVDDAQADEMFKSRWALLVEGFGGENGLEEAMKQEGYTIEGFKRKTREMIEDFLRKQKYVEKHFGRMPVTEAEVDSFFEMYKDSLPPAPTEVYLIGIAVHLEPDSATIDDVLKKLEDAKQRIAAGEEFAAIAAELSDDEITAPRGGILGSYERGDLAQNLDSLAFSLNYGEVGGPVRSPMGYHLLKVVDKAGGKVTLAHILITAPLSPERYAKLTALADTISQQISVKPDSFHEIAAYYDSATSVVEFVDYGWVPLPALEPEFKAKIERATLGEIIGPEETDEAIEMYSVIEKREGRARSLEEDRELIRESARQLKMQEAMQKHIDRLREKFYIEIRI